MRPYSLDLRRRVVEAIENGDGTIEEVAALFRVGKTFVKDMLRLSRTTGHLKPQPHGGGATPALSARHLAALSRQVKRQPDATLEELRHHLAETAHVEVSAATVCRALQQLDLPRKKRVSRRASATRGSVPGTGGGSRGATSGG
jgi:transposase